MEDPARQPQEAARHRVADHLIRMLEEHGIDRVFGIPGGAISPLFDALMDASIEVVVCQHEGTAGYLASGYARATGRPGVLLVTSGPGVLNAVTPVAAAKLDEVPLLVLTGDVRRTHEGRGALQDGGRENLDVISVMAPITKEAVTLTWPERAGARLRTSLELASQHPRGPVFVRIPLDVAGQVVRTSEVHVAPRPQRTLEDVTCERIAKALERARHPAILVGVGAVRACTPRSVRVLAERLACPVITDIESKGLLPEGHALSLGLHGVGSRGTASAYVAGGIDALLVLGARLDDATTNGFEPLVGAGGVVLQLDHDPERLNRSMQTDLTAACDLAATVQRITELAQTVPAHRARQRRRAVAASISAAQPLTLPPLGAGPHHPASVIAALQAAIGPGATWTTDIGNHLIFTAQGLELAGPGLHLSQGLGGMGSGLGTAMGLASARPDAPVVAICGDGTLRMVGGELATCAQHRIPLLIAVLDDSQLGMVEHGNLRVFGRSAWCESPIVDYVGFARSLGVPARRITTAEDLARALATEDHRRGPLLLSFPVDPEIRASNPREKVFSFPGERS
ncbi:MAG: thiamine pyrophosphate-binding protein [Myxococcales bacterium]|nr:thiamine pyrophosphate-binding protein [Myxococcales bacterium]